MACPQQPRGGGHYTINGVVEGTGINITATVADYDNFSANDLTVTENNTTNYPISLNRSKGSVSGTLTYLDKPLSGITVSVEGHSDVTDSNGHYSITDIPTGTGKTAQCEVYGSPYTHTVDVNPDTDTVRNFDWIITWNQTIIGSSIGQYPSMAMDSQHYPHLSYLSTEYPNDRLGYAYFDGSGWNTSIIDDGADNYNTGTYTSLALDSSGYEHISYYRSHFGYRDLNYIYRDASGWHPSAIDGTGSAVDVGQYTSIALDASDHPHISYYDATNGNLKYTYYDGSSWHPVVVDSDGNVGKYTSIAIDSSGHPHISYFDVDNTDLKYAYHDGSTWNVSTLHHHFSWELGKYSSLKLDSLDRPHISYLSYHEFNGEFSGELMYMYNDGTQWVRETVEDPTEGISGIYSCLVLDSSDYPHISCCRNSIWTRQVKYFYKDSTGWHSSVAAEQAVHSTNGYFYTSLGLDSEGLPFISFFEEALNRMTVVRGQVSLAP